MSFPQEIVESVAGTVWDGKEQGEVIEAKGTTDGKGKFDTKRQRLVAMV